MRNIQPADHQMEFVGGAIALDFANTLGGTHSAPTHEHLLDYRDVVEFARLAGTISQSQARRLIEEAVRHPSHAAAVLRRGITLREAIWRVFDATAKGERTPVADVAIIGDEAAAALAHRRLMVGSAENRWEWRDEIALERPLWDVAVSAAELLVSPHELEQIGECASPTCEWLFVDRSRNHTRRWCDMNDCGNQAKVRRFRQRQRAPKKATR